MGVIVTLSVDKESGSIGDTFTFSGHLSLDGQLFEYPVPIDLLKDGSIVGKTTTNVKTGNFSLAWAADAPGAFNFWAVAHTPAAIESNRVAVKVAEAAPAPEWSEWLLIGIAALVPAFVVVAIIGLSAKR